MTVIVVNRAAGAETLFYEQVNDVNTCQHLEATGQ